MSAPTPPTPLGEAPEQPFGVEIKMADGIFVKQMVIPRAGTMVPQHAHSYDHLSMLAVGAIRVWQDGALAGDFTAPAGIPITAGVKHLFLSLLDNTIVYCIHNISRADHVEIDAEHHIVGQS